MLAKRVGYFSESVIREMTRLALKHGAINLGQGMPDFEPVLEVKEAACRAIREGYNQYAITWGAPALRQAIAAKARNFNGIDCDPDTGVTVCCGATECMMATMLALIDPGDEVVICQPCCRRLLMFVRLGLVAMLAVGIAPRARAADPAQKVNVILLVADDLGYADIGVHGSKEVATPHIDSLAKNGVRCSSGYVSCPYCSPTRAGMLTGRYQQRFGHEFNPQLLSQGGAGQGLHPSEVTIANRLKDAGYATALIGKWHQGEEDQFHPLNRGFDEFYGFLRGAHNYLMTDDAMFGPIYRGRKRVEFTGHLTNVLAREASDFIDRHQKQPFFIYLAFNAVHTPLEPAEEQTKKFANVQDPMRRACLAQTAGLDDAVGVVLAKVRAAGLEEQTLIFFISDNGGAIGKFAPNGARNTPLRGSKGDTWEGGIRVPFLVQWKGKLPAGKVYSQPVIQLDIHPTALAVAGVTPKAEWKLDGVNLLPFLEGKDPAVPHAALYWRFGEQMAIRMNDWKLVKPDMAPDKPFGNIAKDPMLFNLADDIGEQRDLAASQPARVKEMWVAWERWNAELAKPAWIHHSLQKKKE